VRRGRERSSLAIPFSMPKAPAAPAPEGFTAVIKLVVERETPKAAPPKIRGWVARNGRAGWRGHIKRSRGYSLDKA